LPPNFRPSVYGLEVAALVVQVSKVGFSFIG
jgi:hypothetical protein